MRAGFNITLEDGGQHTLLITLPDIAKWAKWSGKPYNQLRLDDLDDILYCIWASAVRTGATTDDAPDTFTARIVDIARVQVEDPKATPRAPGNATSSPSKSSPAVTGRTTPKKTSSPRSKS